MARDGCVGGMMSGNEVREQKAFEHALLAAATEWRTTFDAVSDAVLVLDMQGRIQRCNKAAASLVGKTFSEILGRTCWELVHGAAGPIEGCPFLRLCDSGRRETSEFPIGTRWFHGVANPVMDADGDVGGTVLVISDVSERKRTEEILARQAEELARSNVELEQFAYVVSHDLQEPLRMVASYVALLAQRYEGRLDADADEFIGYAVEGARRMQALIRGLLAYSRVGTRGRDFQPAECGMVVAEAIANLKTASVETCAVITHDSLPVVPGDVAQLVQLFQNLIGNAIKFRGEADPRVHISAWREGNEWVFSVRDNGIGISPEFHDRIFGIFQRLHTRDEYPGTGIGLAIAKKVVERHQGRIWVESDSGMGATFYFTIGTGGGKPV